MGINLMGAYAYLTIIKDTRVAVSAEQEAGTPDTFTAKKCGTGIEVTID